MKNRALQICSIVSLFSFSPSSHSAPVWPLSNSENNFVDTATSPFGIRNNNGYDYHPGIDLKALTPKPLYAAEDGVVLTADHVGAGGNGKYVRLRHSDFFGTYDTEYLHLSTISTWVLRDTVILKGEQFAFSGATGNVTGPHLHFAYRQIIETNILYKNPMHIMPFDDATAPSLYYQEPQVFQNAQQTAIDYIRFWVSVPRTELDFITFEVWLHTRDDYRTVTFDLDDTTMHGFTGTPPANEAHGAEANGGTFTFFQYESPWEVAVTATPENFTTSSPYQVIRWEIDPYDDTMFKDQSWIGVTVYDAKLGCSQFRSPSKDISRRSNFDNSQISIFDCDSSYWGNNSGESPRILVNNFGATLQNTSKVLLEWSGTDYIDVVGLRLYRSNDSLNNFHRLIDSIFTLSGTNNYVDTLDNLSGSYYYKYEIAFTNGTTQMSSSFARIDIELPVEYALSQNFPNPFNPSTNIVFGVPANSQGVVELSVYDVLGRKIVSLANGNFNPGVHAVSWDGTNESGQNVASGVYFYRLETKIGTLSRKMILLK